MLEAARFRDVRMDALPPAFQNQTTPRKG